MFANEIWNNKRNYELETTPGAQIKKGKKIFQAYDFLRDWLEIFSADFIRINKNPEYYTLRDSFAWWPNMFSMPSIPW